MAEENPVLENYQSMLKDGLVFLKNNYQMLKDECGSSSSAELEFKKREMKSLLSQSCRFTEMRYMSQSVKDIIDSKGTDLQSASTEYISKHPVDFRASPFYYLVKSILENEQDDPSLRCPITGSILEDPVLSTKCDGHRFSRAAILKQLLNRESIQCPVKGCAHFLTSSDLVEDEATALRLYRLRHDASASQSNDPAAAVSMAADPSLPNSCELPPASSKEINEGEAVELENADDVS